jgi:GNAT superfamily N-acetyltransferase
MSLEIRLAVADEIRAIEPLWRDLYVHQAEHGMLLRLPTEAFEAWVQSMGPLLGRFSIVVVAVDAGEYAGFVAGRTRNLPPYFGTGQVGAISEVFVAERWRKAGIGRQLVQRAVDWYQEQGVSRVELQVVAGNPQAVAFYERLGWRQELVQMVWQAMHPGPR